MKRMVLLVVLILYAWGYVIRSKTEEGESKTGGKTIALVNSVEKIANGCRFARSRLFRELQAAVNSFSLVHKMD